MADEIDVVDGIEQAIKDGKIRDMRRQAAKLDTTNPGGICLSCEEKTGPDRRWCSVECRDAWETNR